MKAIAEVQVIPIGAGVSVREPVKRAHHLLEASGLQVQLHANGTNIEGDWDQVMAALKACHERLHEMGVPRIATNLRLGTRVDREPSMDAKLRSVKEKLEP